MVPLLYLAIPLKRSETCLGQSLSVLVCDLHGLCYPIQDQHDLCIGDLVIDVVKLLVVVQFCKMPG